MRQTNHPGSVQCIFHVLKVTDPLCNRRLEKDKKDVKSQIEDSQGQLEQLTKHKVLVCVCSRACLCNKCR